MLIFYITSSILEHYNHILLLQILKSAQKTAQTHCANYVYTVYPFAYACVYLYIYSIIRLCVL